MNVLGSCTCLVCVLDDEWEDLNSSESSSDDAMDVAVEDDKSGADNFVWPFCFHLTIHKAKLLKTLLKRGLFIWENSKK